MFKILIYNFISGELENNLIVNDIKEVYEIMKNNFKKDVRIYQLVNNDYKLIGWNSI